MNVVFVVVLLVSVSQLEKLAVRGEVEISKLSRFSEN